MSCYNCEDTLTFALDYHYFFYFAEDWISELTFCLSVYYMNPLMPYPSQWTLPMKRQHCQDKPLNAIQLLKAPIFPLFIIVEQHFLLQFI